jgi:hypothetical protein
MPQTPFAKRSALSFSLGCLILAALLPVAVAIYLPILFNRSQA